MLAGAALMGMGCSAGDGDVDISKVPADYWITLEPTDVECRIFTDSENTYLDNLRQAGASSGFAGLEEEYLEKKEILMKTALVREVFSPDPMQECFTMAVFPESRPDGTASVSCFGEDVFVYGVCMNVVSSEWEQVKPLLRQTIELHVAKMK